MMAQQHLLGLVGARGKVARSTLVGMPSLHDGTMGALDLVQRLAPSKAQHLISFILGHQARPSRASLPRITISMSCLTPAGKTAVQIYFQEPGTLGVAHQTKTMKRSELRNI